MGVLNTSCCFRIINYSHRPNLHLFFGRDKDRLFGNNTPSNFSSNSNHKNRTDTKVLASKKQTRKLARQEKLVKRGKNLASVERITSDENEDASNIRREDECDISESDEYQTLVDIVTSSTRGAVLQACTLTSCFMVAAGVLLREVSHVASREGWPINDCSTDIAFGFEFWHLKLVAGSVVLVSTCRFFLLKTWPNFAESSEAANRQILTSLEPLDYLVVAFLPGISEEILFRGAFLPLLGVNWSSILAVAGLFGVLHLGSGRKYSFAIWATFVGLVYGYATMLSSSVVVPMASHALNNLIGGIIWRYTSNSSKKIG